MNGKIYGYKDLIVWQKAMLLVDAVYALMREFPRDERFRLCDQLGRAVVSIPSNIAEGNGRGSEKEYVRFLCIARGSLYETMTQIEIAERQGFAKHDQTLYDLATEVLKILNALISRLSQTP